MYLKGKSVPPSFQQRVLDEVLDLARTRGRFHPAPHGATSHRAGVVVFDLDSTLFDNRPRQARILREYGAARGLDALLVTRPEHITSWRMREAMRNAGLDADTAEQHHRDARAFWTDRFFTSAYCLDDYDMPGAVRFVAEVMAAGAQVAYVTGRDEAMGAGTRACLARYRFPLPDEERVHLLLKPTFELGDDAWKETAVDRLRAIGPLVAAFDNEPAHINIYARAFAGTGASFVHLATDDSGRPIPLAPGVVSIADFTRRVASPPSTHAAHFRPRGTPAASPTSPTPSSPSSPFASPPAPAVPERA